MTSLPRSTPEKQGVHSSAIVSFLDAVKASNMEFHSFMFLRGGNVIAEGWWPPYGAQLPHMLFSLSKTFTSTAVGFAVDEGLLSVDDDVVSFFKDYPLGERTDRLQEMRVRHLLSMSTGHATDTLGPVVHAEDGDWVKAFLNETVEYEPGTHFLYNSGATYMLSAIVQRVTGRTMIDYLQPKLFEPLGIKDVFWFSCPKGINTGGWGLNAKTEDIAKLGQLYLQKGIWNGRRILSEAWINEASSFQVPNGDGNEQNDWAQGYGYQIWRCTHNAYRGDGAFGQLCVVMPDHDAVIAVTSAIFDFQALMNLIWDHLYPGLQQGALPENEQARQLMQQKISQLAYLPEDRLRKTSTVEQISGKTFTLDEGKGAVSFEFSKDQCEFALKTADGEQRFRCGLGYWIKGECDLIGHNTLLGFSERIVASGTWHEEQKFVMTVRLIETPTTCTITCSFDRNRVQIDKKILFSFGPTEHPSLYGEMI